MNEVWRPDFTKDDPWAGMPADYAGLATYVSTDVSPLPPWEEDAPEYIPAYGTEEYINIARGIAEESHNVALSSKDKAERDRALLILKCYEKSRAAMAEWERKQPETEALPEITPPPTENGTPARLRDSLTSKLSREALIGVAATIGIILTVIILKK